MTSPHMLHWDVLSWSFEVEHVDMIRQNVEYRGSMLGLPILVLGCSKPDPLNPPKGLEIWLFQGGNVDEKNCKFSWDNPSPQAHHSTGFYLLHPPVPCAVKQNPIVPDKGW